jgi:ADP-ribose pyrophosphatase YjhB (NUDIX family)
VKTTRRSFDDIANIVVIAIMPIKERDNVRFLFTNEKNGALRFPGGKVKQGESLIDALLRELGEEIGNLSFMVDAMSMIEHSLVYDRTSDEILKSILLYFFLVSSNECILDMNSPRFTLMDANLVSSRQALLPYDNHLIINELPRIVIRQPYIVPPGFLDTPKIDNQIAIRNFCWVARELQEEPPWHV